MLSLDSHRETISAELTRLTHDDPAQTVDGVIDASTLIEKTTEVDLAPNAISHSSHKNASGQEVTALNRGWSDVNPLKWFSLTASWSFLYSACVHPMYFATTHRQISDASNTVSYWTCIRNQFRQHGIRGVYRGFFTLFVGASVSEWMYLGILEMTRENLPIKSDISKDFFSGALADVCSQIFYCPFGLIGNRQLAAGHSLSSYPYLSFHRSIQKIIHTEGLRGLWVGLGASLFLVPSTGIWWSIYGETKRYLYSKNEHFMNFYGSYAAHLPVQMTSSTDNAFHNSIAGAFAGLCITGLVNPVWVMRARVQVMPDSAERTIKHVMYDLWRQSGIRGFYRGAGMNATIYALESALFGTLYDYLKYSSQIS